MKCLGKLTAQLRQIGQRAAEEADRTLDGAAAGQACNRLKDDGLEDRRGDVFLAGSFVEECLDIRFGKYAAAGGDGVQGIRFFGQGV